MNVLGHSHVALAAGADPAPANVPAYVLGAVLPDLASMARVRFDRSRLTNRAVADGARCHVVADAAFHAEPAFARGSRAIRDDLRAAGVAAGPARAIGHVGWELLLDGTLLASPASAAYASALERADDVTAALSAAHRPRWSQLLSHRRRLPRLPYDDPEWVADRLVAILAPRPTLRLPVEHVGVVASVLEGHRERVAAAAPAVLAATARRTAEGL